MRKTITVLLLMAFSLCSFAFDFSANNIYYKITGANTCKVTYASLSYNSYSGNVVVPATVVNGTTTYTVTEIDSAAFAVCSALGTVTLPNTIVKIDSSAFVLSSLQSINIPSSVRYIGSAAFGMTDITTITIPDSVQFIGGGLFFGCSYLTTVNYNAINAAHGRYFDEDFGYSPSFYGCTSLTAVTIGSRVQRIPRALFEAATAITSITVPDGVLSIGDSAFMGCTSLANVQIGSGVATIGAMAFATCSGLTAISARPQMPPAIASNTFSGVNNAIPVTVPCQSISTYRSATGWSYFSNITGGSACNATVRVESNNSNYGSCTGGRVCTVGDTVQIAAIPAQGCFFSRWNDNNTDNPRDIIVTQDTTFTAFFEQQTYIEDADANGVWVMTSGRTISAFNLYAGDFAIYDLGGRCLMRETVADGAEMRFAVPMAGVYVVRNNGGSIKVVVR
ncbi:MAG: leucine-rich repeat domain-containing protein [Bacteroidales bacterium]|nr:leucine-rich repeat domain-containing protein [Bacteroidales bacterium]